MVSPGSRPRRCPAAWRSRSSPRESLWHSRTSTTNSFGPAVPPGYLGLRGGAPPAQRRASALRRLPCDVHRDGREDRDVDVEVSVGGADGGGAGGPRAPEPCSHGLGSLGIPSARDSRTLARSQRANGDEDDQGADDRVADRVAALHGEGGEGALLRGGHGLQWQGPCHRRCRSVREKFEFSSCPSREAAPMVLTAGAGDHQRPPSHARVRARARV